MLLRLLVPLALGNMLLASCGESGSSASALSGDGSGTGSDSSGSGSAASRVEDTLVGRWVVVTGTYQGDTVRIGSDSLTWSVPPRINTVLSLFPTGTLRLYANRGRMGLADGGTTTTDTVRFEYLMSGDTLWMEIQTSRTHDGGIERSSPYSVPLLPLR